MVLVLFYVFATATAAVTAPTQCSANETAVACLPCPPSNCDFSYTTYTCDPPPPCVAGCNCIQDYLRTREGICVLNEDCPPAPTATEPTPETPSNPSQGSGQPQGTTTTSGSTSTASAAASTYAATNSQTANGNSSSNSVAAASSAAQAASSAFAASQSPTNDGNSSTNSSSSSSSYGASSSSSNSSSFSYASSNSSDTGPVAPTQCSANETAVACLPCPPNNCDFSYTTYTCDPPPPCVAGCNCIQNYLRTREGICVLNEDCPPPPTATDPTPETPSNPSQGSGQPQGTTTSGSTSTASAAASTYAATNSQTANGNSSSNSVAAASSAAQAASSAFAASQSQTNDGNSSTNSSSSSSSYGASSSSSNSSSFSYASSNSSGTGPVVPEPGLERDCTYNRCTPTCSVPFPKDCPQGSNPCNCPEGTIVSEEGGQCVQREQCQIYSNCKGDYNATVTDCPIACPSTCAKPEAEYCNTQCGTSGCACNPGYLLSDINGHCIKPEDCPAGNPCGQNETFVGCLIKCPNIYCPVDDRRGFLICDPARPCPSGCACQRHYRRKSVDDYTCILASECPPVPCTRPHEEWHPCPEPCFSDYCRDRYTVRARGDCQPGSGATCDPQCVCQPGFYRNGTDDCVSEDQCPPINS